MTVPLADLDANAPATRPGVRHQGSRGPSPRSPSRSRRTRCRGCPSGCASGPHSVSKLACWNPSTAAFSLTVLAMSVGDPFLNLDVDLHRDLHAGTFEPHEVGTAPRPQYAPASRPTRRRSSSTDPAKRVRRRGRGGVGVSGWGSTVGVGVVWPPGLGGWVRWGCTEASASRRSGPPAGPGPPGSFTISVLFVTEAGAEPILSPDVSALVVVVELGCPRRSGWGSGCRPPSRNGPRQSVPCSSHAGGRGSVGTTRPAPRRRHGRGLPKDGDRGPMRSPLAAVAGQQVLGADQLGPLFALQGTRVRRP